MVTYINIMEQLVEDKLDKIIDTLDCCKCEQCRNDIVAYALNHLPCKYVVTPRGAVYSKTFALSLQHDADINAAVTAGANIVKANPRH